MKIKTREEQKQRGKDSTTHDELKNRNQNAKVVILKLIVYY